MENVKRVLNYAKPSIGLKVVGFVDLKAKELRRKKLVGDRRRKVELLDRCYRVLVQLSER